MTDGRKDDTGKTRWSLLPLAAVEIVAKVMMYGAQKYGDYNWHRLVNAAERFDEAAMRHTVAHLNGEYLDPESGLPHWAHAAASLMMSGWHTMDAERGNDSRAQD
jgi:hypothetical protein